MTVKEILSSVAAQYPKELIGAEFQDIDRIVFHLDLILNRLGKDVSVVDIGGGIGMFSIACALAGMQATLIDDFRDPVNETVGADILQIHKSFGVKVIIQDVIAEPFDAASDSLDVVTCFHSMEHWHSSPKSLFQTIRRALRPGGIFILAGPNRANLRKRVSVLFGHGKWSSMEDWYEAKTFRGHVREPDVEDLRYIARDLGLSGIEVFGRNWMGYRSRHAVTRLATKLTDPLLQLRASFCSDIYMLGYVNRTG